VFVCVCVRTLSRLRLLCGVVVERVHTTHCACAHIC